MTTYRIRLLLNIFLILETFETISPTEIAINDYERLEPKKFEQKLNWAIDMVNRNEDHSSNSIFSYKQLISCFYIQIHPNNELTTRPGLTIKLHMGNVGAAVFSGRVYGKMLKIDNRLLIDRACPDEREIHFLYTDYSNVVVLLGLDSWSGPHIMTLKSSSTNMTYADTINQIKGERSI